MPVNPPATVPPTPTALAGASRAPVAAHDDAAVAARRTRGDLLTVDPQDRRRRARSALLELVVTRSTDRRRG